MAHYHIETKELRRMIPHLHVGDTVSLTGVVYTARDAAHKRILAAMDAGELLPFDLKDAVIYYAGPTPAMPGQIIGSCGPTTSGRMDPYAPRLLRQGLAGMIGKGVRNQQVKQALQETGGVYLVTVGGAGAVIADCVRKLDVIAYEDLGCESVKRLEVADFPAIVAMDCHGGDLYESGVAQYKK